ncbi:MAG: hypothetical protein IAI48_14395 [Candidatus Eremiobacteraeota bacterium]|nr:hypothetical protein [Candidatus Eremiobacteraeota bacterium]
MIRLAAVAMFAAIVYAVPAAAEEFKNLGYSTDDVKTFVTIGKTIPSCTAAIAADGHLSSKQPLPLEISREGAHAHDLCRQDLQRRGARHGVVRFNAVMTSVMCAAFATAGGTVASEPECAGKVH